MTGDRVEIKDGHFAWCKRSGGHHAMPAALLSGALKNEVYKEAEAYPDLQISMIRGGT